MNVAATVLLTDRQRDVLERIDRRVPIKVIAAEMGVSDTRINQHIRALKDKFEVESMGELVDLFRASPDYDPGPEDPSEDPYRNSEYRKSELPDEPIFPDQRRRDDPGDLVLADSHHVLIDAPWIGTKEPAVVSPLLDGDNAVLYRSAAMIGITFAIVAAIILVVSAAVTVSEVLDGKASINMENSGS
jgi:DNA-binding CsgD family transcriptional regulator